MHYWVLFLLVFLSEAHRCGTYTRHCQRLLGNYSSFSTLVMSAKSESDHIHQVNLIETTFNDRFCNNPIFQTEKIMIGSWVGNDVTTENVEKYSLYVYDAQFTVLNTTAFDSLGFLCRPQAETNETYSINDISCFFSNLNLLEGLKQPSTKELFYVKFDDGQLLFDDINYKTVSDEGCNKDPIPTEIPRIFIHTLLQPIIVTDYMDLVGILLFIFIILLFVFIWARRESKKPNMTQRDIFFD